MRDDALAALLLGTALAGCASTAAPQAIALRPAAEPALIAPLSPEENMEWAASVVRVDFLRNQPPGGGVKLFGLAAGDPAMNGLYTQIAFFQGAAEGWRVFRIGDVLDYRVLADSPGRVDLELTLSGDGGESIMGSHTRHVIVTWTLGDGGAAPESISVMPARRR